MSRAIENRGERRRRQPGTLNVMVASNFGLPEGCLDPYYHYHWVNDTRGRPQMLSTNDDYDVVTVEMLKETARENRAEFALGTFETGVLGGITRTVERDGTKAVLMRKPLWMYEEDYEASVAHRQAQMESRVLEGAPDSDNPKELNPAVSYAPKGNTLGDTAPRRRGRIPQRMK